MARMGVTSVQCVAISCDARGCTVQTAAYPTRMEAWGEFWSAGGVEFLEKHGSRYLCAAHWHRCERGGQHAAGFVPLRLEDCACGSAHAEVRNVTHEHRVG